SGGDDDNRRRAGLAEQHAHFAEPLARTEAAENNVRRLVRLKPDPTYVWTNVCAAGLTRVATHFDLAGFDHVRGIAGFVLANHHVACAQRHVRAGRELTGRRATVVQLAPDERLARP